MAKNGINRTISIPQPSVFGRIGSGIGKGISESLPKEIERGRLASGLQQLGEQKNLSPFQQFAGLASTPGITPQMIQSGSELLRQQAYLNALKNQYEGKEGPQSGARGGYSPNQQELNTPLAGEIPTLATPESTGQSYKIFIPPSEQEERRDAFKNFQNNPARYNYDFENALNERKAITSRNQEIQKAHQIQEETAVNKEQKLKDAFDNEAKRLGISTVGKERTLHPKSYQKFEEKVLNSILPKSEGGEGLTQEQAIKTYSKELSQASRNYLDLGSLSPWSPIDFNRRTNALQKDFASNGDQQIMMDELIKKYNVSPLYAAHKAYPINKNEAKTLNEIPRSFAKPGPEIKNNTYEKLKKEMGKTGSPLSIAYELEQKGRSPRDWINYLSNHRDDLEVWQADQLNKNLNVIDLKDAWLSAWE